MLEKINITFEKTKRIARGIKQYPIRDYIDKYNLHSLDVVRTAWELANDVPDVFFEFFLSVGLTQEDIEFLYNTGGTYVAVHALDKSGIVNPVVQLSYGGGKLYITDTANLINLYQYHYFLVRLDTQESTDTYDKKTLTGYYVRREPFSLRLDFVLNSADIDLLIADGVSDTHRQSIKSLNASVLEKEVILSRSDAEYYNSFRNLSVLSVLTTLSIWGDLKKTLEKHHLYTRDCILYLSVDQRTGSTYIYV